MAERRMFTQKIVDSDAFLDMPLSAQALYFHLNMRADDDGFVNNPKRIQRTVCASEDDLKLLILKRFLICFENGVIVIKHWRMHNSLRKDRYTPTQYQEEFDRLGIKDNGAYTERVMLPETAPEALPEDDTPMATEWQPDGNQAATQVREGKDRIGKDSEGKGRDAISYQQVADLYNEICISLPRVRSLSEDRKKAIKARIKSGYTLDEFKTVFEKAEASSFLKGKNPRNWSATFDWLITDRNMAKVLDGNYDDKGARHGPGPQDYGNPEDFYN